MGSRIKGNQAGAAPPLTSDQTLNARVLAARYSDTSKYPVRRSLREQDRRLRS
ncbi:hypothetical protein ACFQU7_40915 [Pseudoroseomonas wenyumeiae]|uniref:hypothetical protein n=1 Tax=Teichococcus wenyumeiae TaxID=2478470 RepID=UPI0013147031|nr:hypothetical protein [Pseudoroseomonas wenyumeiae]